MSVLPRLREDLRLLEGPPAEDGSPTWTVEDPARHRYFRLHHTAFELLSRWQAGTPEALLARVRAETTLEVSADQVAALIEFLTTHQLVVADSPADVDRLLTAQRARKQSVIKQLLHGYLFFRIPLLRPDAFLTRTLPWVEPLYSRGFHQVLGGLGVIGLLLVARQWDTFVGTVASSLSWEGALSYVLALAAVKICHELGHAYTVKRYGGRVPTMGIAFLVLWPVLYTDTSDAWRLPSRRQRALIAAAGVLTELGLAIIATLLWSFLPDGAARHAAFFVAAVSWVTSLAINLGPFTRFDGYYILSDLLGMDNLQDRGFALARWRMREWLFGLHMPPPENLPSRTRHIVLVYAYAAWIYRLVLFLGIALLVYHAFFKLLGIALFVVEIAWFVLRPLWQELKAWWMMRESIRASTRARRSAVVAALLMLWFVVPWQGQVSLPAVWGPGEFALLYAESDARVVEVERQWGAQVSAGDVIYRLDAPEIELALRRTEAEIGALVLRLRRSVGSGEDLQNTLVLQQAMAQARARRHGLMQQQQRLVITAPLAGTLVDTPHGLSAGQWIPRHQPLGRIVAPGAGRLIAYLAEADWRRVTVGAEARFFPDNPALGAIDAQVEAVETADLRVLDQAYVASVYGGELPVERDARGALIPTKAFYRVILRPHPGASIPQAVRGRVQVSAARESLLGRVFTAAAAVLVRESGF